MANRKGSRRPFEGQKPDAAPLGASEEDSWVRAVWDQEANVAIPKSRFRYNPPCSRCERAMIQPPSVLVTKGEGK